MNKVTTISVLNDIDNGIYPTLSLGYEGGIIRGDADSILNTYDGLRKGKRAISIYY